MVHTISRRLKLLCSQPKMPNHTKHRQSRQRDGSQRSSALKLLLIWSCHLQTREASEDVMLGSHLLPAGTRLWINVRSLHLDDRYFPNAKVVTHFFFHQSVYDVCATCEALPLEYFHVWGLTGQILHHARCILYAR